MNAMTIEVQMKSKLPDQCGPVRDARRTGLSRLLWGALIALFCSQALANNHCINSTYPQTVTAETVAGQTRLIFGRPTNAGIGNITFTINGNLVTLNYDYFDGCVIVPPATRVFFFDLDVLLPPGNYQLRAIGKNPPNTPYDVTRPFVVQGVSQSVTIPTTSQVTLVLLALLMVLTVGVAFRRER